MLTALVIWSHLLLPQPFEVGIITPHHLNKIRRLQLQKVKQPTKVTQLARWHWSSGLCNSKIFTLVALLIVNFLYSKLLARVTNDHFFIKSWRSEMHTAHIIVHSLRAELLLN